MPDISPITFTVEGLGAFQARPRTLGTEIAIERQYAAELGGTRESEAVSDLRYWAKVKAELSQLLVEAPPDFDLETMHVNDILAIFKALRSAEDRFLGELAQRRQVAGAGA